MPRLRRPRLARLLCASAVVAAPFAAPAYAQVATTDQSLLRAQLDGDPRDPPRFWRRPSPDPDATRFGQPQNFNYRPAQGAGVTGFDSTNQRRAGRATAKPKPAARVAPTPPLSRNHNSNQAEGQDQRQNQRLSQTQQPRTGRSSDAAFPVGALTDPPQLRPRRQLAPEADVFAPIGVQVGGFLLKPAVELTGAFDTNPARSTAGKPSWFEVVAPELLVNSNWSRHEVAANLRGSYSRYEDASDLNRPSADARLSGRVDVTPWSRLDLEGRFLLGTDNPGSPNIQAGLTKLPIVTTLGGSAGIGQRFNRLEVTLKGGADRSVYQNSTFTDGTTSSNADRDFDRYLAALRAGYELTPGIKPFVETGVDQRVHGLAVDRYGVRRDSNGYFFKGGTTFELTRILTGDLALGWIDRSYKDPTLPNIGGLTFDSSLTWLASALTTVKLTARTVVDESTLVGVAGVFTREVGVQVDHAFRRWLSATLKVTRASDDYVGSSREDERYGVSGLITYKLTRDVWLKAEYRREWRHSNQPGNDAVANMALFGLRLQR